MSSAAPVETEIKLRITTPAAIVERIHAAGFVIHRERIFEANNVYDTPDGTIRARGQLLRVRQAGQVCTLTWKGPAPDAGPHKSRREIETTAGSADALEAILRELGYSPRFRYEKYRTEFSKPEQAGIITLDETPIGWFLELEGAPEWIDRTAASLGFQQSDYITASYSSLYLAHCSDTGKEPGWMVFSATQG